MNHNNRAGGATFEEGFPSHALPFQAFPSIAESCQPILGAESGYPREMLEIPRGEDEVSIKGDRRDEKVGVGQSSTRGLETRFEGAEAAH